MTTTPHMGRVFEPGGKYPGGFKGLETSATFMSRCKTPHYVVKGLLQCGMIYTLTGNTGHAKTSIGCLLTRCMLTGDPFAGRRVKQGSVVFLAGENPDNVRVQWAAAADCHEPLVNHPNLHWHNDRFDLAEAMDALLASAALIPSLNLIVIDTLQAFHGADDENSNIDMLKAARQFRKIVELPSRPAVLIMAHPVKNATRDNLVPRGGSSFLNEIDGNLMLWRKDSIVELSPDPGKYRGPPFDPIKFELMQRALFALRDEDGQPMTCAVAVPMAAAREADIEQKEATRETRALVAIRDNPDITCDALGKHLGSSSSAAHRVIKKLREKKWIKEHGRGNELLSSGKAVLKDV